MNPPPKTIAVLAGTPEYDKLKSVLDKGTEARADLIKQETDLNRAILAGVQEIDPNILSAQVDTRYQGHGAIYIVVQQEKPALAPAENVLTAAATGKAAGE